MAVEYFNSLGGYSAGIPPVPVIDSNGNVISNFNNLSGNVSANTVYAYHYKFANGAPFEPRAGGDNTQLQYNNNGQFGGIPYATYDGNILNLGDISTLSIGGGINGYFLQTDGEGRLTWASAGGSNGGGNTSPGGSNMQVQFNDQGLFGGDAGFYYNKNSNTLFVGNTVNTANLVATRANVSNVNAGNVNVSGNILTVGNVSGNYVLANYFLGNGSGLTGIVAITANSVVNPGQPNITSVGTLTSLNVSGGISTNSFVTAASFSTSGSMNASNIQVSTFANITGLLNGLGNVSFASSPSVNLGQPANLHIAGGLPGYILSTDGSGNLSWIQNNANAGRPGGNTTQVQFNDGGVFAGVANFAFNQYSNTLTVDNINTIKTTVNSNLTVNSGGILRVIGNLSANSSPNVSLGYIGNIHIFGGTNGQVLTTDGLGNLAWQTSTSNGNGVPGGSNTQIQFNDNGLFGGSPYFTFNKNTTTLNIAGDLVANSIEIGSGIYKFSKSNVIQATSSTTSVTPLISLNASTVSAVDYTIVATSAVDNIRQVSKLSAIMYDQTLDYNEYNTLNINGLVGNFTVGYQAGNIIAPPQVTLYVEPYTNNYTTYKIQMTVYEE
jgi:hypothetical protein